MRLYEQHGDEELLGRHIVLTLSSDTVKYGSDLIRFGLRELLGKKCPNRRKKVPPIRDAPDFSKCDFLVGLHYIAILESHRRHTYAQSFTSTRLYSSLLTIVDLKTSLHEEESEFKHKLPFGTPNKQILSIRMDPRGILSRCTKKRND